MSIVGVAKLFVGKPVHPVGDDGRMALSDHLRELRARLLKSVMVVLVILVAALFFFDQIYDAVYWPAREAEKALPEGQLFLSTNGPGAGLMIYLKLCGFAALVLSAPFWLYQIWAFILPGLHPRERKWTRIFAAIAGPLFLVGAALGYVTLAKGIEILVGFNPDGLTNIVNFDDYLSFFSRTILVFGIAFEIPLFVVLLNLAGVVKGKTLGAYRPWIIVGVFVFAAVATPSADPFTMTLMAVPMVLLFLVSEVIARYNDRRRARKNPFAGLDPDEISPIS
ncbi:twin-arginine translocase subunit TatC [Nocardioides sp. C4-1]|uniref:twin-arginine translocase subunit TatC n=1 Tax=Nocardioides sp. C4-1 TaxID=3151851 RepID=UPI003263AD69